MKKNDVYDTLSLIHSTKNSCEYRGRHYKVKTISYGPQCISSGALLILDFPLLCHPVCYSKMIQYMSGRALFLLNVLPAKIAQNVSAHLYGWQVWQQIVPCKRWPKMTHKFKFWAFLAITAAILAPCAATILSSDKKSSLISPTVSKDETAEDLVNQLRQLKRAKPSSRAKRSIKEHYSDLHCLQKFETSPKTILRTAESQENGATFLNASTFDSFEMCLAFCCETLLCNVAVYDETVRRPSIFFKTVPDLDFFLFQGGNCFMFDCGPPLPGEFLCRFTENELFTSGALETNRHEFDDSRYQSRESHANELSNLLGDYPLQSMPDPPLPPPVNAIDPMGPRRTRGNNSSGSFIIMCPESGWIILYRIMNPDLSSFKFSDRNCSRQHMNIFFRNVYIVH